MLRLYWEVAVRGYRRYSTYRGAAWAGVFTNSVFGFMRAYVFMAFLSAAGPVGGFDVTDALTYVFVTQGMIMLNYLWGWWDIALRVRSGDVATDLYRPLDFQAYWLAQDLGRALYHGLYRGIPPFLVGAVVFHLRLPEHPATWLAFGVSCALAVCVSYGMRFIVNLSAFWLLDYGGAGALFQSVWVALSGFVIPIAFFPGMTRSVVEMLPFAATIEIPIRVFLEKPSGLALLGALGFQAAWAIVLLAAGRVLLAAATRRLVVQGG